MTSDKSIELMKIVAGVAMAIITPITLGAVSWLFMQTMSHGEDLSGIKASRFSSADGAEMRSEIGKQLNAIQLSLHDLDKKVPQRERMDTLEDHIHKLQLEMVTISQSVKSIEQTQAQWNSPRTLEENKN